MPFNRPIQESQQPAKAAGGLKMYVEAEKLMQIALVLPATVAIGYGAGWLADQLLHQKWIEIVGLVLGCVSGLYYVVQTAIAAEKNSPKVDSNQNGTGKGSADDPS